MGFWSWVIGGYTASVANNKFNPPTVIAPDGYEVRGIKAKGTNVYEVTYAKKGSSSSAGTARIVRKRTTGFSTGFVTFKVYW